MAHLTAAARHTEIRRPERCSMRPYPRRKVRMARAAAPAAGTANCEWLRLVCRAAAGAQFMRREIIHIDEIRDLGIVIT